LFNRAEGFLYTIADATVLSSDTVVTTAITTAKQNNNLLSLISDFVETVLKVLLSQTSIQFHFYFDSVDCKIETVI
jgi:hypothetical protein